MIGFLKGFNKIGRMFYSQNFKYTAPIVNKIFDKCVVCNDNSIEIDSNIFNIQQISESLQNNLDIKQVKIEEYQGSIIINSNSEEVNQEVLKIVQKQFIEYYPPIKHDTGSTGSSVQIAFWGPESYKMFKESFLPSWEGGLNDKTIEIEQLEQMKCKFEIKTDDSNNMVTIITNSDTMRKYIFDEKCKALLTFTESVARNIKNSTQKEEKVEVEEIKPEKTKEELEKEKLERIHKEIKEYKTDLMEKLEKNPKLLEPNSTGNVPKHIKEYFKKYGYKIKKLVILNRGEIAQAIIRTAKKYGIKTVALCSDKDYLQPHVVLADEYHVFTGGSIQDAYKSTAIIDIAKKMGWDTFAFGYGFNAENGKYAKLCEQNNIRLISPGSNAMLALGNKNKARNVARGCGVPILEGIDLKIDNEKKMEEVGLLLQDVDITKDPNIVFSILKKNNISVDSLISKEKQEVLNKFIENNPGPYRIKAVDGGGGRGQYVVKNGKDLLATFIKVAQEIHNLYGNYNVIIEQNILKPMHFEVQLICDKHGNILDLGARNCSVQRKYQKIVETAGGDQKYKEVIKEMIAKSKLMAQKVGYDSAGTWEFLFDTVTMKFYFLEVNTRLQVEHPVSEGIMDVSDKDQTCNDLITLMTLSAMGANFKELGITQDTLKPKKDTFVMELRLTTDSTFGKPYFGDITRIENKIPSNVRFEGVVVEGHFQYVAFDQLLGKIIIAGKSREECVKIANKYLDSLKITGLTNNIMYLKKIINHPVFLSGDMHTTYIEDNIQEFELNEKEREEFFKIKNFDGLIRSIIERSLGMIIPQGAFFPKDYVSKDPVLKNPTPGKIDNKLKSGSITDIFYKDGPEGVVKAIMEYNKKNNLPYIIDVCHRDWHQSQIATRLRLIDMIPIMEEMAKRPDYLKLLLGFEFEGGATTQSRVLFGDEKVHEALKFARGLFKNHLLFDLKRACNGVAFSPQPKNVLERHGKDCVKNGNESFRIFDSMQDKENLRIGIEAAKKSKKMPFIVGYICVPNAGKDVSEEDKQFNINYYLELAKFFVSQGVHALGIKDHSGFFSNPKYAKRLGVLVKALREKYPDMPIFIHLHNSMGDGHKALFYAWKNGASVLDTAFTGYPDKASPAQVDFIKVLEYFKEKGVDFGIKKESLSNISDYFKQLTEIYAVFSKAVVDWLMFRACEVGIPGGMITNWLAQLISMDVDVVRALNAFPIAVKLLGEDPDVTPKSKYSGNLAVFLVRHNLDKLSEDEIIEKIIAMDIDDIPIDVINFCKRDLGEPRYGWTKFCKAVQIAFNLQINVAYASNTMQPANLDEIEQNIKNLKGGVNATCGEVPFYAMFPTEYNEWIDRRDKYGSKVSLLPTSVWINGVEVEEEIVIDNPKIGDAFAFKIKSVGKVQENNFQTVIYEIDGVEYISRNELVKVLKTLGNPEDPNHVVSPLQGKVVSVEVNPGDEVKEGDILVKIEAMKMEVLVKALRGGKIEKVIAEPNAETLVNSLLMSFEEEEEKD
ncbi:biotin carboxylase N-terminal domain-containing protein [Candidatus Margulisiibacteriota bacterium]